MPIHGSLYYDIDPANFSYSDIDCDSDDLDEQLLQEYNRTVNNQVENKRKKLLKIINKCESILRKHKIEIESSEISNKRKVVLIKKIVYFEKKLTKVNDQMVKLNAQKERDLLQ